MALTDKLTAIANAIRAKTGKTDAMTLDAMATEIESMSGSNTINQANIPDYIKTAVLDVANKVEGVRKSDSIIFMAMSDSHHVGTQDNSWGSLTNKSNLHACMAAKILSYALRVDFNCHLGDTAFGNSTTTSTDLKQQVGEFASYLNEAYDGIPQFRCVGNHDTGQYNTAENGSVNTALVGKEYLFDAIGKYCEGATYGNTEFGYCYRDFDDKKVRVICLNSSEGETLYGSATSYAMSPAQLKWFAQTLYDVGSKTDASKWSIIVLSHFPLDYFAYGMYNATTIVKAYVEGTSTTQDGTTFNYNGHNGAKFVAAFHGHVHCFSTSKLHTIANNTGTKFDAWRVAVPNSGYHRQNQYADVTMYGINWGETETYNKVEDTYQDCAFVVNVVNPSQQVIHSFCYGAGYDRVVGYGETVWHKITRAISQNAKIDSSVTSVEHGKSYTTTITPAEHCVVSSVTIKMGGIDITSSAYSNGVITIPEVIGEIVITVEAELALACTNWIPLSTDSSGQVYNGVGYKDNLRLNGKNEYTESGLDSTGFIPIKIGDVIRVKDMNYIVGQDLHRIQFYDSSYQYLATVLGTSTYILDNYLNMVVDENQNCVQFTLLSHANSPAYGATYMRICCANISDASILTINEEIIYADELDGSYTITKNLSNATSSNTATIVAGGSSYTTNIAALSGYELGNVVVTMGGVDITSKVYSNGVISIDYVTGNVVITVNTTAIPTYTNQIAISTDTDGTVFNGKGYKENSYLSSGTVSSKTDYGTTGFIPAKSGDVLRFKNVGFSTTDDYSRFSTYKSDRSHINTTKATVLTDSSWNTYITIENNEVVRLTVPSTSAYTNTCYIRFCAKGIGADSIITVNEEIV